jgi:hypothetical protein
VKKSCLIGVVCAALLSFITVSANAALIDRGGGLIYDTDLNITWLADANYAMTSGYIGTISTVYNDGRMTQQQAVDWAAQLSFGGFDEWRLPSTPVFDPTCSLQSSASGIDYSYGYGCTGGEMSHLYHVELSGIFEEPISSSLDPDLDLFINIHDSTSTNYWSDLVESWGSYGFHFLNGGTNYGGADNNWYAWAVHEGDIGAVPIPASLWLFGSGLLGLIGLARRKTNG